MSIPDFDIEPFDPSPQYDDLRADFDAVLSTDRDRLLIHLPRLTLKWRQARLQEWAPTLLSDAHPQERRVLACTARAAWLTEAGWTQAMIADHLNNEGQTTLRRRPWTQASVSRALGACGLRAA